jgi:hypothetical protein
MSTNSNVPHITSRINGLKIPFPRGQAGILHRFTNPDNKLIISEVSEHGSIINEGSDRMVVNSVPESEVQTAAANAAARAAQNAPIL